MQRNERRALASNLIRNGLTPNTAEWSAWSEWLREQSACERRAQAWLVNGLKVNR